MTRIIRFLAVIALALSPVWGVQTVVAASSPAPAHYPTFPSYASNGCATAINGYITCGGNGIILTQVNSGYACSTIVVSFDGVALQNQPLVVTVTANSGSFNSNFSVSDDGDYSVNIPGFLVNNLAVVQITASTGGSFFLSHLGVSTCSVPSATPSPNPSDTATDTPLPVTGTPTPIPTFTPVPVGHSTFTRTPTVAPGTNTPAPATFTPTVTPSSLTEIDCGESSFPLLNCNQAGSGNLLGVGNQFGFHWGLTADANQHCVNGSTGGSFAPGGPWQSAAYYSPGGGGNCNQGPILAGLTGIVHIVYTANQYGTSHVALTFQIQNDGGDWGSPCSVTLEAFTVPTVEDRSTDCTVTSGSNYDVGWQSTGSGDITLSDVYVLPSGSTPGTGTPSPTLTGTITPTPSGPTATFTNTPIPVPGAPETAIPTDTECPGSCVVTSLTAIPGMATRTTVDTSPFSALTHLSMARSSCAPFGYVQIPYPVITGTPALGQPLNFGWTVPVTHTWDNTNPLSNTAIQPCAMSEIPSSLWDFTYWFSVFGIATVFIMWLIGLVGRLSGEETING